MADKAEIMIEKNVRPKNLLFELLHILKAFLHVLKPLLECFDRLCETVFLFFEL